MCYSLMVVWCEKVLIYVQGVRGSEGGTGASNSLYGQFDSVRPLCF